MKHELLFALLLLATSSDLTRANDAAAQSKMAGLSREDLLACMGRRRKKPPSAPPKSRPICRPTGRAIIIPIRSRSGYQHTVGEHDRSFCTVSVTMKNGIVTTVRYNGPNSSSRLTTDDQCGYAVKNCVHE